ncbi:MAG: pyrimidine 5'-nucleotidase [Anaerolineales bacterium]|nr:pyrimidine 5'-nucleotidase [Anaerolineales bacterium]
MLRYLLFDLDETLYTPGTGLWEAIGQRINLYMTERLGLSTPDAEALRARYRQQYGIALTGLMADYAINPDEYLNYVHDLPIAQYLQPDSALNAMLARLPLPKAILTNSDAAHSGRVLAQLGIARHFTHIVDVRALEFVHHKPKPEAYQRAAQRVGVRPEECVFIDDLPNNLAAARAEGMITIHISHGRANGHLPAGVDYQTENVLGVERIVAGLIGQTW